MLTIPFAGEPFFATLSIPRLDPSGVYFCFVSELREGQSMIRSSSKTPASPRIADQAGIQQTCPHMPSVSGWLRPERSFLILHERVCKD